MTVVLYKDIIYNILINKLHKTISITIADDLLKEVDKKKSDIPESKFITRALESKLQDLK